MQRKEIINRLNRMEGQLRGIGKMVQEDRSTGSVIQQISAVRSALGKVGVLYAYYHHLSKNGINPEEDKKKADSILKLIDTLSILV